MFSLSYLGLLLLISSAAALPQKELDQINCSSKNEKVNVFCFDRAWWAIYLFDSSVIASGLPEGLSLSPLPPYYPAGKHPVIFEFGTQNNCELCSMKFIKTTFFEFKYEIPYVQTQEGGVAEGPFLYKPAVFSSTLEDTIGSETVYGLPTFWATMNVSYDVGLPGSGFYSVSYEKKTLNATFQGVQSSSPLNLTAYTDIMKMPWLCRSLLKRECALDWFDFQTAKVSPARMQLSIEQGFLPHFISGRFTGVTGSIADSLDGTVRIDVPLAISYPQNCR